MTMTGNLGDTLPRENGVRVNQINPGWILTPNEIIKKQKQGLPPDWPGRLSKQYAPSGQIINPAVVASAAIYFLSDESKPVSGSVLDLEQYPLIGPNPGKDVV